MDTRANLRSAVVVALIECAVVRLYFMAFSSQKSVRLRKDPLEKVSAG
jgi:hypothetical protein